MKTGKSTVFAMILPSPWIHRILRALLIILAGSMIAGRLNAPVAHAAFFKKEFTVCKDQGRDILCDPYVVQKNDYVTKLFKQRGEIAHEDFPRFLGIFKRINPNIRNINKIYPGREILIPLKALPPGTLEGQSSGTVTLPIIMISDLPDLMTENSSVYEVKAGDTVWELIVKRFGGLHRKDYVRLKALVQRMNPHLTDLNRIYVGQKIRLPDSAVRNTLWYDAIFDATGRILEKPDASGKTEGRLTASAPRPGSPDESSVSAAGSGKDSGPAKAPDSLSVYAKVARILNAELMDKGEFFFPRRRGPDLRIDLEQTPVMQLPGGFRLLFDHRTVLSDSAIDAVRQYWQNFSLIRSEKELTLREVFYKICPVIDMDGCSNKLEFSDGGIVVTVRGEYIYDRPGGDGKACLTFIESEKEALPVEICRYLGHHWIEVEDWIHRPERFAPARPSQEAPLILENVREITAASQAGFVRQFLDLLGYDFRTNVDISFPYAGFRVSATTNMVTAGGEKILVDFCDFKGDAIRALESLGFRVIQIPGGMDYYAIAARFLEELKVSQKRPPLFWAADRRRIHNTSVRIPGTIITIAERSAGEQEILIPQCKVPPEIQYFLAGKGLELLQIDAQ